MLKFLEAVGFSPSPEIRFVFLEDFVERQSLANFCWLERCREEMLLVFLVSTPFDDVGPAGGICYLKPFWLYFLKF